MYAFSQTAKLDNANLRSLHSTLNIAEAFTRPGRLFLNRPLISVLDDLGVPTSAFVNLLREAVEQVEDGRTDYSSAGHLVALYDLGRSLWLQRLVAAADDFAGLGSSLLVDEPFIRLLMGVGESSSE